MSKDHIIEAKMLATKVCTQFQADDVDPNLALVAMSIVVAVLVGAAIRESPNYRKPGFVTERKQDFLQILNDTIDHALEIRDGFDEDGAGALAAFQELHGHAQGTEANLPPV